MMNYPEIIKENTMSAKLEGIKILVAEDEDSGFRVIERICNEEGITTIRANNGREAVDIALKEKDLHIVIMDIKMPVLNGVEATRIISKRRPELPVITTSAFAMPGDKKVFFDAGSIDHIQKPIKAETLLSLVMKYI